MSATVGGAPRHVAGTHAMDRQAGGVPLSLPELQRLPWISSQRRLIGRASGSRRAAGLGPVRELGEKDTGSPA